jgi:hypothetical protein
MYEKRGQSEQAHEIRSKIKQAKAAHVRAPKRVDFYNPTPAMIEDGKKNG